MDLSRLPDTEKFEAAARRIADDEGLPHVSFVKEALKWQYNWISLAGLAALAIISGTALPVLLGAGLELMYLALVPQSSAFRRLVRSWKYKEEKAKLEQSLEKLYQELPEASRRRYGVLQQRCREIMGNFSRLSSTSQMFMGQIEQRLLGLLNSYLRLLNAGHHHNAYLGTVDSREIDGEIEHLQKAMENESERVREINRKRVEILSKRKEKFEKIEENMRVIQAQLGAIEDVLALIRDQSVTMRDPQEVSGHLDSLMQDVEHTEETVRQVEAVFSLETPELDQLPSFAESLPQLPVEEPPPPPGRKRERTR